MNPGFPCTGARVAWAALAILVAASLSGCAKRATRVDAGYTTPEGVSSSNARMVMWLAATNTMDVYQDVIPFGLSPNDPLVRTQTIVGAPVGSIHGMVLDRTEAQTYEILRREPGGGLRIFEDFTLRPTRKWLDAQWESYRFDDFAPSGFQPPSYVGRGRIDDKVTDRSPVTNEVTIASAALGSIDISVTNRRIPGVDTVAVISWSAVAGAANYLLHIYEFRAASVSQQQQSGLPAPMYDGQSRDHFVIWFRVGPGTVTSYQLGDSTRTDVDIMFERKLLPQPEPEIATATIRVVAVDATGRMIAYSLSPTGTPPGLNIFPRNYGIAPVSDTEYGIYPLGALQMEHLRLPRPR